MAVIIEQEKCGGCGSCIDVCPTQALEKPKPKVKIEIAVPANRRLGLPHAA